MSEFFSKKSKDIAGIVVKKSSDKTVCVEYEVVKALPKYKKIVRLKRKMLVHDPKNETNIGDRVWFYITRPISKRKYSVISRIEDKLS